MVDNKFIIEVEIEKKKSRFSKQQFGVPLNLPDSTKKLGLKNMPKSTIPLKIKYP